MNPGDLAQRSRSGDERDITTATPSEWLSCFDASTEARHVADLERRLRADVDLVTRLAFSGYKGTDWHEVANLLAAYGLRVLTAWIIDGTIVRRCTDKGWSGPWDGRCRAREIAEQLAADTVAVALIKFRDTVLMPCRWQPDRGASLSTFFIGQCLLRWANVYRQWRRAESRQVLTTGLDDLEAVERPAVYRTPRHAMSDPAGSVVDRSEVEAALAPADAVTERIVRYRAAGFAWDEISVLLGIPIGALRGKYTRFQEKARRSKEAS